MKIYDPAQSVMMEMSDWLVDRVFLKVELKCATVDYGVQSATGDGTDMMQ